MENRTPILVITCAAIAREVNEIKKLGQWSQMDLQAISADLHAYPEKIPAAVAEKIDAARGSYAHIFVAYGDCGTSGELDRVLDERGVKRLPGAHCYDFLAGRERYARMQDDEPGTFYLTDFLTRHFDRLVKRGLGLDRHPQLMRQYFGNYRRVMFLSQSDSPELERQAREHADYLGLEFRAVQADSGAIGGSVSHEFHVLAESGEDAIAFSSGGNYAANIERAEALAPAGERPAPTADMTVVETPGQHSIEEVCNFMQVTPQQCVKTLLVQGAETGLVALVIQRRIGTDGARACESEALGRLRAGRGRRVAGNGSCDQHRDACKRNVNAT